MLIRALGDRRAMIRGNAALVLGQRRELSAVGFLIPLLREDDAVVRLKAVMALGNIATPDSTAALVRVVHSEADPEIKGAAIRGLVSRNTGRDISCWPGLQKMRSERWRCPSLNWTADDEW